jgi:hypothetical protein
MEFLLASGPACFLLCDEGLRMISSSVIILDPESSDFVDIDLLNSSFAIGEEVFFAEGELFGDKLLAAVFELDWSSFAFGLLPRLTDNAATSCANAVGVPTPVFAFRSIVDRRCKSSRLRCATAFLVFSIWLVESETILFDTESLHVLCRDRIIMLCFDSTGRRATISGVMTRCLRTIICCGGGGGSGGRTFGFFCALSAAFCISSW